MNNNRGLLAELTHSGQCVRDRHGGPFCLICGSFSGGISPSRVDDCMLMEWSRFHKRIKIVYIARWVLFIIPIIFSIVDNIFGITGLSYFDYELADRRGINDPGNTIDLVTLIYLIIVLSMVLESAYLERKAISILSIYPSFKYLFVKIGVFWTAMVVVYSVFYPILQDSRKYLMPRSGYSIEQIYMAYDRVYLALIVLVFGYGSLLTIYMIVRFHLQAKIKRMNMRVIAFMKNDSPVIRFEEGWG